MPVPSIVTHAPCAPWLSVPPTVSGDVQAAVLREVEELRSAM